MLTNPYMVHEFGTKFYVIGMYSIFMIATEFILFHIKWVGQFTPNKLRNAL